jgi:uncharacterized protein DUF4470
VNDNNPDIVARNIILLLIAMVVEDVDKAVDCIIHVWYSVIIRKSDLEILQQLVKPLVQDICDKTKGKKPDAVLGKTWKFGSRSLRVELPKSYWDRLLTFFDVPYNATVENVLAARKEVARRLVDLRDRELTHMPGHTRLSVRRYLDDGILLPFGANRDEFTIPNPYVQFPLIFLVPVFDAAEGLLSWTTNCGPKRPTVSRLPAGAQRPSSTHPSAARLLTARESSSTTFVESW